MNKTVNINLGGMFFHIDEDAYQKLTRYFDAIKRSLSNSGGQEEIIKDIEMRIGELISERHTHDKQVINMKEIDEIITIMGQPEDYRIADDGSPEPQMTSFDYIKRRKKLYRDTEKGILGGVCSGLGHYFGIDAVWIRIVFSILVLVFGVGIIPYIILWIAMPAAVTTAEKLEMTGEPVTISNIERKVREEFENVSERFKNSDYMGKQAKTGAERVASNIGEIFSTIFKIFAKIIGAFVTVFAAIVLCSFIIGLFILLASLFFDIEWLNYASAANYTSFPLWAIILLGTLAIGIPFFFLFILGLKLLVNNLKSIGNPAKYTLLAVWLIAVAILSAFGIKQGTETAYDGKTVQKQDIVLQPTDTLVVKFRYDDYYAKDVNGHTDVLITQDEKGREVIYSNNVNVTILKSPDKTAYIKVEKQAHGKSLVEAKKRAGKINYGFTVQGNQIVLDNYLVTDAANRMRRQEVEVYIYLPEGVLFRPDASLQEFDYSDNEFFNLHHSGDYLYRVGANKVMCLDCPKDENEYNDVEGGIIDSTGTGQTTITIGHPDIPGHPRIKIEHDGREENRELKTLRIDENGIIVKTK